MPNNLEGKSSADIDTIKVEKEKELSVALDNCYAVEQERLLLQKDILGKQAAKKDLDIALSKAEHIVRQLNIEIKLLNNAFWNARNSGI